MAAIEIDTSELRSATGAVPSPVQKRLEAWSPTGSTALGVTKRVEAAGARREAQMCGKVATLAKNNDRATEVAAQHRAKLGTVTNRLRVSSEIKAVKAATLRSARLQKQVDSAAEHTAHAQEVAAAQKAEETENIEAMKRAVAQKEGAARRRADELLIHRAEKGKAEVEKAESLSAAKKQQLEAMRRTLEEKHGLAESRKEEQHLLKMDKLAELNARAKQVRKNKGTSVAKGTAAAENKKAAVLSPVQFDMFETRAEAANSPARLAFEARLKSRTVPTPSPLKTGQGQIAAKKAQTLARAKNAHVNWVAEAQRDTEAASIAALEAKVAAKQADAEERRNFLLTEAQQKAGAHFEKAVGIRDNQKTMADSLTEVAEAQLAESMENATERREDIAREREVKRKHELELIRKTQAKRQAARDAEIASKKKLLQENLAAASLKRAENLEAVTKNAKAFASPWSPERSELSPTKPSSSKTMAADTPTKALAGAVVEALDAAADPSPRKGIKAFLAATPVTPPPTQLASSNTVESPSMVPIAVLCASAALGIAAYVAQSSI